MIDKNLIQSIADRYGIEVKYAPQGEEGNIIDSVGANNTEDDDEKSYELKRIEYQISSGYVDITDTCGDEVAFGILREAIELYKEKHKIG